MIKRITIFLFLLSTFQGAVLYAQNITVTAKIDSTQIWIGQQTKLTFELSQQPDQHVESPIFSDVIISGLEIVERLKPDTVSTPDGHIDINMSYVVTAFEDTLLLIPPFPFVAGDDTIWSRALSIKVIQPFLIDTTQLQITDIKSVFSPKFNLLYFLKKLIPWLLGLVVVSGLIFLIIMYLKKKPGAVQEPVEPELPPHELALMKLEKIKHEKLWQQNRHKEYHSELTDVLREYIEGTFQVPAMEMTSDEILSQLNFLRIENKAVYGILQQILHLADLIKFAKWNVGPDEHELSLTNAFLFVNQTKIEEEKKEDDIS